MNVGFRRWTRFKKRFWRSDMWLVVALLTLGLWTVDALLMYLEMHPTFGRGIEMLASHFWYVLPVTMAVIALSRMRPQARLLGLALYDQAGRIVEQQGDAALSNIAAAGMLAGLHGGSQGRLHGVSLSSGGTVYFLRQNGSTLMLHYSAPAAPEELAAGVGQVHLDRADNFDLLSDLEPETAALAADAISSRATRKVLAYFGQYKQTSIQLEDLAYQVTWDQAEVAQALDKLTTLGLVERQCACGRTFFRLTCDPALRRHVEAFADWHSQWDGRLARLQGMLG